MKIYPILNNLGKGKYVFIFILNERAVAVLCIKIQISRESIKNISRNLAVTVI